MNLSSLKANHRQLRNRSRCTLRSPLHTKNCVRQTNACLIATNSQRDDRAPIPLLAKTIVEISHGMKCVKVFINVNERWTTPVLYADLATCFRSLLPLVGDLYSFGLMISVNYDLTPRVRSCIEGEIGGIFQGIATAAGLVPNIEPDTDQTFEEGSDFMSFRFIKNPWHDYAAPVWP
jgi:hypothetical protein